MTHGPLPAILLAAIEHPNKSFREQLWDRLDKWLLDHSPTIEDAEVLSIIKGQSGTFYEPFRLEQNSTKLAIFLTRLALSEKIGMSRFRIVSEDTIGNTGGLIITKKLRNFYSERYVHGKNRLITSDLHFFAPSMKVDGPFKLRDKKTLSAIMNSDEKGLYLDISNKLITHVGWQNWASQSELQQLIHKISLNSRIGSKGATFSSIGLSFEAGENGFQIAAKSPEALIRFSSYVVQGQSIHLSGARKFGMSIELPKKAEGKATINVVAQDDFADQWMNTKKFGSPDLSVDEIKKISDWSFQHAAWLN